MLKMIQSNTTRRDIRILFGFSFLGILLFGLRISADKFGFHLPINIHNVSLTSYTPRYELPPVTVRNVTYYTYGGQGNRTRGRDTYGGQGNRTRGRDTYGGQGNATSGRNTYGGQGNATSGRDTYGGQGNATSGRDTYGGQGNATSGRDTYGGQGNATSGRDKFDVQGNATSGRYTYGGQGNATSGRDTYDGQGNATSGRDTYDGQGNATSGRDTYGGQGNRTSGRVTNVAFLKVHKAGSSTMQNLFFRFGLRHNLNILFPKKGNYLHSMREAIPIKPPSIYNIFACHTRYSKSLFDQIIPTGSVKIGIVREPVDRIVSAAYYYRDVVHQRYLKRIPQADFIHNLIKYPEKYDERKISVTHNAMGFDFGFSRNIKSTDKEEIESYLNHLNSEFELVLVMERFDESLVMMKRYLSWSFHDIIYWKINSNKHKNVVLNVQEQAKARETNFLDFALYEYFTKVFEKELKSMTDDFYEEVDYFRRVLSEVVTFCSQKKLQNDSKLLINQSVWEEEFTVLGEECQWMKTPETVFLNTIRRNVNAANNLTYPDV